MLVPPKMTVSFKPNTSLKDRVRQNQNEGEEEI